MPHYKITQPHLLPHSPRLLVSNQDPSQSPNQFEAISGH
ncbi:hypothetical protein VDG1235_1499 [Verrucomicrobiia bacterium DG1235]|nr:hypothetical protein VDG1235_1499 [Verrucomicrobiae bacterium DG1235]